VPDRLRTGSPCPDLADLLLASEGELPKRRQLEIAAHVDQCATCRETLGAAGLAIREYQDAEQNPQAAAAATVATAARVNRFRTRLRQEKRDQVTREVRLPVRRWLPVAAAVPVLVAALFFSNRYGSVVRAEELLTRAVAQEQSAPIGTVRRVEIRVRRGPRTGMPGTPTRTSAWSMTRELGTARPVAASQSTPETEAESDELATLLEANHFDWRDPLSVRSFSTWRDSLTNKTDSVTPLGSDALTLRTTTPDGLLRSAELIVRRVDFQPVKQTLNFEGFGEVEIVELSRWVSSAPMVADSSAPPAPAVEPTAPNADTLEEAELDVRKTLHDLAVDWDPAIAVERSGRAVEVRGRVDGRRRAEIAHALGKIAPVRVTLRSDGDHGTNALTNTHNSDIGSPPGVKEGSPPPSATGEEGPAKAATGGTPRASRTGEGERPDISPKAADPFSSSEANVNARPDAMPGTASEHGAAATSPERDGDIPRIAPDATHTPLQRWLERTFGRGERSATFIPGLAADAERVQRRTAAFAALAARYPASETRRLSVPARKKLEALADAEYRDLVRAVEALDDRLALFLGTTTRQALSSSTPRPWQACATAMSTRVEDLRRAIEELMRQRDLPLPTEFGQGHEEPPPLSNLRRATDSLWNQLRSTTGFPQT